MPRKILTDEQRKAKKKAAWAKVVAGKPSLGVAGTPEMWARIAESMGARFSRIWVPEFQADTHLAALLEVFGFDAMPTLAELKAQRRRILLGDGVHPDRGGSGEMTRKVLEAYDFLASRIKNA